MSFVLPVHIMYTHVIVQVLYNTMVQSPHNRRGDPSHCATRVHARVTCVLPLLIAVVFTACTADGCRSRYSSCRVPQQPSDDIAGSCPCQCQYGRRGFVPVNGSNRMQCSGAVSTVRSAPSVLRHSTPQHTHTVGMIGGRWVPVSER